MIIIIILGVAAAILTAGFYAGLETAAYRTSQVRLRYLAESGDRIANTATILMKNMPGFITVTLIGHNLAVYAATFLITREFETLHIREAELFATAILAPICFVFAETTPKQLACTMADSYMLQSTRIVLCSRIVFAPINLILNGISKILHAVLVHFNAASLAHTGRNRLIEYLKASVAEGVLTDRQQQITQRIMEIEELTVGELMIPMARVFNVSEEDNCRTAAEKMIAADFHRAMLTNRSGDASGTFVTLFDIMSNPATLDQPATCFAREALRINQRTSIAKALHRMKATHAPLALVTGKGNRIVGLVAGPMLLNHIVRR